MHKPKCLDRVKLSGDVRQFRHSSILHFYNTSLSLDTKTHVLIVIEHTSFIATEYTSFDHYRIHIF